MKSVTRWAFQIPPEPEIHVGASETELSLVDRTQSEHFNFLKERAMKEGFVDEKVVENAPKETAEPSQPEE